MNEEQKEKPLGRRAFLRGVAALAVTGTAGLAARKASGEKLVWQIDPLVCVQCGNCATECVLNPSAVKCVNSFSVCGYCNLCFGYFQPGAATLTSGAENQVCPTGAIIRKFIEDPYFEYTVDRDLCTGCAKCVKLCDAFGNGSLYLQIQHDLCVNCNECAIARRCPSNAISRVPAERPYLLKGVRESGSDGGKA